MAERPGWLTIWTRCDQCQNLEGWDVPDDGAFVIPPCELCGSDQITLADYHPDAREDEAA